MGPSPYEQIVQVEVHVHDLEGRVTGVYDTTTGLRLELEEAKTSWSALTKMIGKIRMGFALSMKQIMTELHDLKDIGHAHHEDIDNAVTSIEDLRKIIESQRSEALGQQGEA